MEVEVISSLAEDSLDLNNISSNTSQNDMAETSFEFELTNETLPGELNNDCFSFDATRPVVLEGIIIGLSIPSVLDIEPSPNNELFDFNRDNDSLSRPTLDDSLNIPELPNNNINDVEPSVSSRTTTTATIVVEPSRKRKKRELTASERKMSRKPTPFSLIVSKHVKKSV